MSSTSFECVGPGEVLGYLRGDLRRVSNSLFLVGPWLDDYFATEVVRMAPKGVTARIVVRPECEMEPVAWERTSAALTVFHQHWPDCSARTLSRLHAKCILLDGQLLYLGSVNWYRFSLEQSVELVVRGPAHLLANGVEQLEAIWDRAEDMATPHELSWVPPRQPREEPLGITREILDPLAAEALRESPKAFVLGKKRKSGN